MLRLYWIEARTSALSCCCCVLAAAASFPPLLRPLRYATDCRRGSLPLRPTRKQHRSPMFRCRKDVSRTYLGHTTHAGHRRVRRRCRTPRARRARRAVRSAASATPSAPTPSRRSAPWARRRVAGRGRRRGRGLRWAARLLHGQWWDEEGLWRGVTFFVLCTRLGF